MISIYYVPEPSPQVWNRILKGDKYPYGKIAYIL